MGDNVTWDKITSTVKGEKDVDRHTNYVDGAKTRERKRDGERGKEMKREEKRWRERKREGERGKEMEREEKR